MTAKTKHASMLTELRRQVKRLESKEKATHRKLRQALAEVKKIAKTYEKKLIKKTRDAKVKVAAAEALMYTRLAESIKKHAKNVTKVQKAVELRAASKKKSAQRGKKTK